MQKAALAEKKAARLAEAARAEMLASQNETTEKAPLHSLPLQQQQQQQKQQADAKRAEEEANDKNSAAAADKIAVMTVTTKAADDTEIYVSAQLASQVSAAKNLSMKSTDEVATKKTTNDAAHGVSPTPIPMTTTPTPGKTVDEDTVTSLIAEGEAKYFCVLIIVFIECNEIFFEVVEI